MLLFTECPKLVFEKFCDNCPTLLSGARIDFPPDTYSDEMITMRRKHSTRSPINVIPWMEEPEHHMRCAYSPNSPMVLPASEVVVMGKWRRRQDDHDGNGANNSSEDYMGVEEQK